LGGVRITVFFEELAMITVSVFHENKEGKRFDLNYYLTQHIPAAKQKLGVACKRIKVDQGLSGRQPGSKPPFLVMTHLFFDSVEAFRAAYAPIAAWAAEDRKNFTDDHEPPFLQISEVKI
jgi:uncharacterized protein (TIGR02118 family)